jgi:hypothetical protein
MEHDGWLCAERNVQHFAAVRAFVATVNQAHESLPEGGHEPNQQ